jgi:hypothetical protein
MIMRSSLKNIGHLIIPEYTRAASDTIMGEPPKRRTFDVLQACGLSVLGGRRFRLLRAADAPKPATEPNVRVVMTDD